MRKLVYVEEALPDLSTLHTVLSEMGWASVRTGTLSDASALLNAAEGDAVLLSSAALQALLGRLAEESHRSTRVGEEAAVPAESPVGAAPLERPPLFSPNVAFDASSTPMVITSLDGKVIYVNPAFLSLWGYSDTHDVIGRHWATFCASDTASSSVNEALLAAGAWDGELSGQRTDGSEIELDVSAHVIFSEDGARTCVLSTCVDVTERNRADRALRSVVETTSHVTGNQYFRELVRSLAKAVNADAVLVAELAPLDDRVCARTLAFTKDGAFVDCAHFSIADTPCEYILRERAFVSLEKIGERFPEDEFCTAEGFERCLGIPLLHEDRAALGVLVALYRDSVVPTWPLDKLFHVASERAAAEVARLHSEETARLRQRQLLEADRMASLEFLTAGVTHEINNPNGCIRGGIDCLKILLRDALEAVEPFRDASDNIRIGALSLEDVCREVPQLLDGMRNASERIARLVNDLREFSRQAPESIEEKVDLNRVVSTAVRLVAGEVSKHTDRFEVVYGSSLPLFSGNPQRLVQVAVNLLTNACRALGERNRAVRVTTRYAADTACVVLEVEDEGQGIPLEHLKHVTDLFFTTKRTEGRTGLGLSVASAIVADHGGALNIDSVPGKGTKVHIAIPVHREAAEPNSHVS